MIFMNFLARSSRVTGPKIRVPIGSSCLLIRTAALRSKRMALPSTRRSGNDVRTTTARCTSPFFTRPRGMASFTETTMTSPTLAYLRREPPNTLMHCTRRAPELSATSRLVRIWIMASCSPRALGLRALDQNFPALGLGHRAAFADLDVLADLALEGVGLVVRVVLLRPTDELLVDRVLDAAFDAHDDGLVHLVADDDAFEDSL